MKNENDRGAASKVRALNQRFNFHPTRYKTINRRESDTNDVNTHASNANYRTRGNEASGDCAEGRYTSSYIESLVERSCRIEAGEFTSGVVGAGSV